jgi:hypothetical protein
MRMWILTVGRLHQQFTTSPDTSVLFLVFFRVIIGSIMSLFTKVRICRRCVRCVSPGLVSQG